MYCLTVSKIYFYAVYGIIGSEKCEAISVTFNTKFFGGHALVKSDNECGKDAKNLI